MSYSATNRSALERIQARHWTNSEDEVLAFARDMVTVDFITTIENLLDFFEKPWKWDREHAWWVANGRPDTGEAWEIGEETDFEVNDG